MRFLLLCLSLASSLQEPTVNWTNYPAQKSARSDRLGAVLTDIEEHLPASYGSQYQDRDPITHAHETTHGINSELRRLQPGKQGFYCLEGKAAYFKGPRLWLSQIAPLVPVQHRLMLYRGYLVGAAREWNDTPTYILDEWVAYINGAACGIDRERAGLRHRERAGTIYSPVEFIPYVLALCQAIEQGDAAYLQTTDGIQFKAFVAYEMRRATTLYWEGMKMPRLQWDAKLVPLDATLRALAVRWYGEPFVGSLRLP